MSSFGGLLALGFSMQAVPGDWELCTMASHKWWQHWYLALKASLHLLGGSRSEVGNLFFLLRAIWRYIYGHSSPENIFLLIFRVGAGRETSI